MATLDEVREVVREHADVLVERYGASVKLGARYPQRDPLLTSRDVSCL